MKPKLLRVRQRLGKYRIEGKIGEGAFAVVYRATDTLEGVRVALKIPFDHLLDESLLASFRHEIRLAARLRHDNIMTLKNADFIDGRLALAYPLGERTLGDRLGSRIGIAQAYEYALQMVAGVAYAHENRVIHCDIKPDNMILFPGGGLKISDFGIAKVAFQTINASGAGTVGFCAPEQAMGKPSFRSDVFSLGVTLYRMFSGELPVWPFAWPPPGHERLRRNVHPDFVELMRRAISVDPTKRYAHAGTMYSALRAMKRRVLAFKNGGSQTTNRAETTNWKTVRFRQFRREFGRKLETCHECACCSGPVSEAMMACPWCGADRTRLDGTTSYPQCCPRCHRGLKLDWSYCPWCYGAGFEASTREYSDRRYSRKCTNRACSRKELMPFMRYCPWCKRKVRQPWSIEGSTDKCAACGWGVLAEYWSCCPWCGTDI